MNVFISNKYTKWYKNIVSNPTYEGYTENHHIIPRCIGGEETVSLSARQHFVCHWLLTKMTKGQLRYKMISAFSKMCFQDSNGNRYVNSHGYRECREKLMPEIGKMFRGYKFCHKDGQMKKVSPKDLKKLLKEGWTKGFPKEFVKKMPNGMKGKHKSKKWCHKDGQNKRVSLEEYKLLLKEGWASGRIFSDETMDRMRKNGFKLRNRQKSMGIKIPSTKDKKWCHKDGKNIVVSLEEYRQLLKEGWTAGMFERKTKGRKYCHKDSKVKCVPLEEYHQLLKEGWEPGRCLSNDARQKMRECALNSVLISHQRKA